MRTWVWTVGLNTSREVTSGSDPDDPQTSSYRIITSPPLLSSGTCFWCRNIVMTSVSGLQKCTEPTTGISRTPKIEIIPRVEEKSASTRYHLPTSAIRV